MQLLIDALVWATLLLSSLAAPLNATAIDAPFNATGIMGGETKSLQLTFIADVDDEYFWVVFYGPRGTAIEPCGHDKRFRDVAEVNYKGPVDWNNPPMPNKVIKKGTHDTEKDCYYENDGKGNYGEFNCYDPKNGQLWYHDDLKIDPHARDAPIDCLGPGKDAWYNGFKRMAYVEF